MHGIIQGGAVRMNEPLIAALKIDQKAFPIHYIGLGPIIRHLMEHDIDINAEPVTFDLDVIQGRAVATHVEFDLTRLATRKFDTNIRMALAEAARQRVGSAL